MDSSGTFKSNVSFVACSEDYPRTFEKTTS